MIKDNKTIIMAGIAGLVWLVFGISCDKAEVTSSAEVIEDDEIIENKSGISFDMESDSLVEEIEEIRFNAEEWGEEDMNVDL